jgi:hypothetical protein
VSGVLPVPQAEEPCGRSHAVAFDAVKELRPTKPPPPGGDHKLLTGSRPILALSSLGRRDNGWESDRR